MINNFKLLSSYLLEYEDKDVIYHLQILQRQKDLNLTGKSHVIKNYYIKSQEHLLSKESEIIALCNQFKARAYLNVAPKELSKIKWNLLDKVLLSIRQGSSINLNALIESAVGSTTSFAPKWIIDIDKGDDEQSIINYVTKLCAETSETSMMSFVHTLHGCHIIVSPINLQKFQTAFPTIDVHKNNGTVLYCPDFNNQIFTCSKCGGTHVQLQAWIDPQTNTYIEDAYSDNIGWCRDCHQSVELKLQTT